MKINIITCDICNSEMPENRNHCGFTIHIKGQRVWWWHRRKDTIRDIDVCSRCYSFIQELVDIGGSPLRTVYEIYERMCPADMQIFENELIELAKDTDRYYVNHPHPDVKSN